MRVITSNQGIKIELQGREQILSMRAKITATIPSIKDITFYESFNDWRKWQIRMPGTNAPKLLLAGSYWTEEGWDFIYSKRPIGFIKPTLCDVLVINTDKNRYSRIILSHQKEQAEKILKWWRKVNNTHL